MNNLSTQTLIKFEEVKCVVMFDLEEACSCNLTYGINQIEEWNSNKQFL